MTDLYLYQTVHLARGRARLVAEHATVLNAASQSVFRRPYTPDVRALTARIEELAAAERYPKEQSCFVRIELTPEGEERLLPAGASFYDGYAHRSLMPDAVCVYYDLPFSDKHISSREATAQLAAMRAGLNDADVAVQCTGAGIVLTADDAPLFALKDNLVVTSPVHASVERDLAIRAIGAAGFDLAEEPLEHDALPLFDELFYADHRGITSLAHCNSQPYMSLAAERIAEAMEGLFCR